MNVKLSKVLNSITQQTGLTFAYSPSVIDVEQTVTIEINNTDLIPALKNIFTNKNIDFEISKDKIYLMNGPGSSASFPKKIKISGVITNGDEVLVGASIIEKGTTNGTITDFNGKYTLEVDSCAQLAVSYIGYITQKVMVNNQTVINVNLSENSQLLNEVVITALGIRKKEAPLSYSIQQIDGIETTRCKDGNFINTLAGKAANVVISRNSSGLGASSRVIIRGGRSTSKNNQPLYAIDGMPILNSGSEQSLSVIGGIANAGNRDGGDGVSNLNPEDIKDITILRGQTASALYGSQASNGVILINTKRGICGINKVEFSSSLTFNQPNCLPEFQNSYKTSENGLNNWGEKSSLPVKDNLKDFFRTGTAAATTLVLTSGTEKIQSYISYANTTAKGIIYNNRLNKHNLNIHETIGFFDNRLTVDANAIFVMQKIINKSVSGGYYMNPLAGLYTFPRGKDISIYKNNFELYDENHNIYVQNWYKSVDDGFEQNPYWLINRAGNLDERARAIVSAVVNLNLAEWITIQMRGNLDYLNDRYSQGISASGSIALVGENGRYINSNYHDFLIYGDVIALINKSGRLFDYNIVLGAGITDTKWDILRLDSKTASLYYPNIFTIANIRMNSNAYIDERIVREQSQSVFASIQMGYKKRLYLELTARNEWSSTLAYTPSMKNGFFYPSIGTSWIINKSIPMPGWVSLGKLRSSWSKVGNGLSPYTSYPQAHITAGGAILENHVDQNLSELKPEMTSSIEIGTEWSFFNRRLSLDFTLYSSNTKNQLFRLPSDASTSLYKDYDVTSGNIQNSGFEISWKAFPVINKNFSWKIGGSYSQNKNIVLELNEMLPQYMYGNKGLSSSYFMILRKNGSFGDIYGRAFERNESEEIQYETSGMPKVIGSGDPVKVGNCEPKFLIGLSNHFSYKGLSLYFLLDGRFGGEVLSQTQAEIDKRGLSKATGIARDRGYVNLEGKHIHDIESFYSLVGGNSGVTEYYMYDATNIRLREFSLSYSFPKKLLNNIKYIIGIEVSAAARNLFFLYKKAPFDPDAILSSGNDNQGVDVFGTPMTRSIGFSMRVKF